MQDSGQLETVKTPPGQMFGAAWKAMPSVEAVDAQKRGGEVPPGYCIIWMGAQHPEAPLGYQQRLDSTS